jgi:hypothetical protein
MFTRILLNNDPTDGGGGSPSEPTGSPTPGTPPAPESKAPSLDDMRQKIEERGVEGAAKMLLELAEDNFKYRSKLRDLEGRLPEGAVVLKGDDAKAWQTYRDFGRPADIKAAMEERQNLASWKRDRERSDTVAQCATLHGYKASVLERFAKADGLSIVIDTLDQKTKDGKPVQKGFVVTRGDDGQETRTSLDEYAERHWTDGLDALKEAPTRPKAADRPDPMKPSGDGPREFRFGGF